MCFRKDFDWTNSLDVRLSPRPAPAQRVRAVRGARGALLAGREPARPATGRADTRGEPGNLRLRGGDRGTGGPVGSAPQLSRLRFGPGPHSCKPRGFSKMMREAHCARKRRLGGGESAASVASGVLVTVTVESARDDAARRQQRT
jgi:hypothetical protein